MDMFWIVPAVRHGIPVWIAYLAAFFSACLGVIYRKGLSERVRWYRVGYICSMAGLFAVGWTVHFWGALLVFFLFLLGSGVWMLDWEESDEADDNTAVVGGRRTAMPYTRFPARSAGQVSSPPQNDRKATTKR